ncbi:MAG: ABC transporter substrate-binding protein [Candidatus Methanomethyliaceae archaeon]
MKWLIVVISGLVSVMLVTLSGAGSNERALAGKFESIAELFSYRTLPRYQEAPSLARLVAEGKLPPVESRLPPTPFVWSSAVMVDGIGVYGDILRQSRGSEPECWANMMGCWSGWDGGEGYKNEGLVDIAPMWMLKDPEPLPNLATHWEWSEDGYTLTMYLLKGVKWSDGVEFTADDVLFTYYDNILDPNVPSLQNAETWTFGGKVTELEKVDDYTIKWHFGAPYPIRVFQLLDSKYYAPIPAHIYKYYHPKYNPNMTYDDYLNSSRAAVLPAVVLGPFVPVYYEPGKVTIYVRNPFYYKVDEQGNQLPYFDAVMWIQDPDWTMRNYRILTGEVDAAPLQDARLTRLIYAAAQDPKAPFVFQWGPFTQAFALFLNFSLYRGIRDSRDVALRQLFRELKFRQALAHAIDREAIAAGVFGAPDVRAYYGGYPDGSPYYNEDRVVKYSYDPDRAKSLLAELGFRDIDGDGILNWPHTSLVPEENLTVELIVAGTAPDLIATAEAVEPYLRAVGIDVRLRVLGEAVYYDKQTTQEFDLILEPTYTVAPDLRPETLAPITSDTPWWHKAGSDGKRDLLPFEERLKELVTSTFSMVNPDRRREAFEEVLTIYTENLYSVPVIQLAFSWLYHKRHKNYPSDLPVYLYDWYHENIPVEIRWCPPELQLSTEQYLQYIPTPEAYKTQPWYPGK